MRFDVVIVGAGAAGLCFAQSLATSGLHIAVLERQTERSLESPIFDGREIALTHHAIQLMRKLDVLQHIDSQAISPLRDARVLNGLSRDSMTINLQDGEHNELGYLISNNLIRKAAYQAVKASPAITLKTGVEIGEVHTDTHHARLTLKNGVEIEAQLLVAADSRFSETRRAMGISANMHDFGRTMMVCVMEHEVPHHHVAWEWFDFGQTLALLPMNGKRSSIVITLPAHDIQTLMAASEEAFNAELQRRFKNRLGSMRLVSTRHAYPLVTVYPERFVAPRFALVGDAAVGMHPVTAHGFNFGLRGIETLSNEIKAALAIKTDFASPAVLSRYERTHQQVTRPLFLATHAIAKLYSDDRLHARLIRRASIHLGNRITPFKRAIAKSLIGVN